ncbi:alpha/beta hydrolase [Dechloromonas sp. XY25]|uniref:Alpha/beta hydrolase n=1 Tax=Dechloromonas hankyongensis TaxID=2908002 RepID=A0ABS9K7S0_9RHOO|nr:alpha/beta hydrolase [Dechloromonas hankyongensis]MCG2579175.1 alpha/beta hydrolase [Dechloromonas hankyongensis]
MTHFLADDGAKIHVQISGEGSPVIMLHGWTSSHQEWFPFLSALNARHRVYRWDARGHGGHHLDGKTPPTAERMARDLANLIAHFGIDKATVVGHSMGALTLWQYIRDFGTGKLARACFIDQSPKLLTDDAWPHGIYGNFDQQKSQEMMSWLHYDFAEAVLKLTAFGLNARAREKYLAGASGWEKSRMALRAQNPGPLIDCWASLTAADYRDVLATIDIPSMLIYGGESNFYGLETARYVANQIPNALLHIYEGTDHSPHQWQRERFMRDLLAFIDETA